MIKDKKPYTTLKFEKRFKYTIKQRLNPIQYKKVNTIPFINLLNLYPLNATLFKK